VSLYTLLETVIGPLWVGLAGFEWPSVATLAGGIVILAALAGNGAMGLRAGSTGGDGGGDGGGTERDEGDDSERVSAEDGTGVVNPMIHGNGVASIEMTMLTSPRQSGQQGSVTAPAEETRAPC
jgi:hypothetical protein